MKKLFILFVFLLFSLSFGVNAKDYYWDDITTHLYLQSDGTAEVSEIQSFNFNGSFTYAYRYFHFDEIANLKDIKIYEKNNKIIEKEIYNEKGMEVVKWYYKANNEKRNFTLEYQVKGLMDFGYKKDSLFWTAVFKDHEKEVRKSSLYVHFPRPISPSEISFRTEPESSYAFLNEKTIVFNLNSPLKSYS